ncbi:hypothetical protein YC2023_002314 [Brassica napus]
MDYALSQLIGQPTKLRDRGSCKVGENEEANNKSHYTLVNQAFAIAVKKVLEGYISGLDTLCASAELRRSSNIVGNIIFKKIGVAEREIRHVTKTEKILITDLLIEHQRNKSIDVCLSSTSDSSEHKTFFSDPTKSSRRNQI